VIDVDGVDCPCTDQGEGGKALYSQKYLGAALRYELATSTGARGDLVHINGPKPPGDWNDLSIFREVLMGKLRANGEKANADDGYGGEDPDTVISTRGIRYMEAPELVFLRQRLRNRHETFNGRIKHFKVLANRFHHPLEKHSSCFRACCVLIQLTFSYDRSLFGAQDATDIANALSTEERRIAIYERASAACAAPNATTS
jgi:hypothetical protein